jgi:hypothetical protein
VIAAVEPSEKVQSAYWPPARWSDEGETVPATPLTKHERDQRLP